MSAAGVSDWSWPGGIAYRYSVPKRMRTKAGLALLLPSFGWFLASCADPETPLADFENLTVELRVFDPPYPSGSSPEAARLSLLGNESAPCLSVAFELPASLSGAPMRQERSGGRSSTKAGRGSGCRHVVYTIDPLPDSPELEARVDDGSKVVRVVAEHPRAVPAPEIRGLDGGIARANDPLSVTFPEGHPLIAFSVSVASPGRARGLLCDSSRGDVLSDRSCVFSVSTGDGGVVTVYAKEEYRLALSACEGASECDAGYARSYETSFE